MSSTDKIPKFENDCEAECPTDCKSYHIIPWKNRLAIDESIVSGTFDPSIYPDIEYDEAAYIIENDFYFWLERQGHLFILDLPADDEEFPDIEDFDVLVGRERV